MIEKAYARMCGLLTDGRSVGTKDLDCDMLCRETGVASERLENLFYERLGMSPEDVFKSLCRRKLHI